MWTKIKLFLGSVGDFLKPLAKMFASAVGGLLKDAALQAVMAVASDPKMLGSGGLEKRQAAFGQIVNDLKGKGVEVGVQLSTSMINVAIETAYQKLIDDGKIKDANG